MGIAYAFAIVGGIANSFLDTCVSPTCMEIYVNNPSVANLFTKFSMCISQFLLPFLIGFVAAANMSYRTIFIVAGSYSHWVYKFLHIYAVAELQPGAWKAL